MDTININNCKITKTSGIYLILNKLTGDYYIGSATTFSSRRSKHLWALKRNKHENQHLQNAWNKYGGDNFIFVVLEIVVNKKELRQIEQWYLDNWNPRYNKSETAQIPTFSEEGKRSMVCKKSKEWIITSPHGAEIYVKNLEEFCRKNNLNRGSMGMVARGKLSNHKGWQCRYANESRQRYVSRKENTIIATRSQGKYYLITYPDGKQEQIKGLSQWCREKRFSKHCFERMLKHPETKPHNEQLQSFQICEIILHETKIDYNALRETFKCNSKKNEQNKRYLITYPDGYQIEIVNLKEFCRHHQLNIGGMYRIMHQENSRYHGFNCMPLDSSFKKKKSQENQQRIFQDRYGVGRKYIVERPDGVIEEVFNLNQYARDHDLSRPSITRVVKGERTHYKGYKFKEIIKTD